MRLLDVASCKAFWQWSSPQVWNSPLLDSFGLCGSSFTQREGVYLQYGIVLAQFILGTYISLYVRGCVHRVRKLTCPVCRVGERAFIGCASFVCGWTLLKWQWHPCHTTLEEHNPCNQPSSCLVPATHALSVSVKRGLTLTDEGSRANVSTNISPFEFSCSSYRIILIHGMKVMGVFCCCPQVSINAMEIIVMLCEKDADLIKRHITDSEFSEILQYHLIQTGHFSHGCLLQLSDRSNSWRRSLWLKCSVFYWYPTQFAQEFVD